MPTPAKLTVCVPSRNRQAYLQETIRSLLSNPRGDIQFVFSDNSDDPSIMLTFMTQFVADPRVVFLPSTDRVLSMMDNWNRSLEAATGDFICVIGDDDYVDVDVIDLIDRCRSDGLEIDVLGWDRVTYNWPDNREARCSVAVPMKTGVTRIERSALYHDFFSWSSTNGTPRVPFAVYHGAVSKRLMDRIKARFGGRYCEFPVVDFESHCKVVATADNIYYCERPFSVMGACIESNSAKINRQDLGRESHVRFMKEVGRNIDEDPYMQDFPFPSILGLVACIAQTQRWFLSTYGLPTIEGWEANLAAACGVNAGMMQTQADYDLMVDSYREALTRWQDGRYLDHYRPAPFSPAGSVVLLGTYGDHWLIDENSAGVATPAALYGLIDQMLARGCDLQLQAIAQARAA